MTVKDIVNHLTGLAVTKSFTKATLTEKIRKEVSPGHPMTIEIPLPDGLWSVRIEQYRDAPDLYGYWLPETRAEEHRMLSA